MKVKFDIVELPEKPDDGFVSCGSEVREYSDDKIRDNLWCTVCGWPEYPKCCEWCKDYEAAKAKGFKRCRFVST